MGYVKDFRKNNLELPVCLFQMVDGVLKVGRIIKLITSLMETPYFTSEYFASKKSMVDEFCISARQVAERFARECKEKRLPPSYESFTRWMEATHQMIA